MLKGAAGWIVVLLVAVAAGAWWLFGRREAPRVGSSFPSFGGSASSRGAARESPGGNMPAPSGGDTYPDPQPSTGRGSRSSMFGGGGGRGVAGNMPAPASSSSITPATGDNRYSPIGNMPAPGVNGGKKGTKGANTAANGCRGYSLAEYCAYLKTTPAGNFLCEVDWYAGCTKLWGYK